MVYRLYLVKYLEDRGVFPQAAWFARFQRGARSFFDVLRAGDPDAVHRLLRVLEDRFNGDIFRRPGGGNWNLTASSLKRFAELVEAQTLNRQRYLWAPYSFEHLPVEVISHLYQRFIKQGRGTVYTPPLLASLLLDHVMPYDNLDGTERVLDPACGSGVFLVGAYRRLINPLACAQSMEETRCRNAQDDPPTTDFRSRTRTWSSGSCRL